MKFYENLFSNIVVFFTTDRTNVLAVLIPYGSSKELIRVYTNLLSKTWNVSSEDIRIAVSSQGIDLCEHNPDKVVRMLKDAKSQIKHQYSKNIFPTKNEKIRCINICKLI